MKIKSIKHLPCPTTKSRTIPIYSEYNFVALAFLTINILIGLHLRYSRLYLCVQDEHTCRNSTKPCTYTIDTDTTTRYVQPPTLRCYTPLILGYTLRVLPVYISGIHTHTRARARTHTHYILYMYSTIYIYTNKSVGVYRVRTFQ